MEPKSTPPTKQFIINILIIILTGCGLWLMYTLSDFIGIFLISCFLGLLLGPFVAKLRKWGCPDVLGIFAVFTSVFLLLSLFLISIVPLFIGLAEDSKSYIVRSVTALEQQARTGFPVLDHLPLNLDHLLRNRFDINRIGQVIVDENRAQLIMNNLVGDIDTIKNFMQVGVSQVSSIGLSFASGITSVVTTFALILLLTFFIILERRTFLRWFFTILPGDLSRYFHRRQHTISNAIHVWLRGQLLLAGGMFILNLVGLSIAQYFGLPVEHIFSLALIAGVMEFVPYLGPVISFIPAFLMVLVSPDVSLWAIAGVIGLYILFQQIEGNFMVTMIMSHTLRLSSLYILVVTLIGASLGGALGVLLAIPLASILHIFYHDWMHYRHTTETE